MSSKKFVKGFTLIELLVVIAIISILAVVGFTVFRNVSSKARDAKRLADVNSISKAYEVKYPTNSKYVNISGSDFTGGVIPKDPDGTYYYNILADDGSGFRVCTALEANPTRSCDTQSSTCSCKESTQSTLSSSSGYSGSGGLPHPPSCDPSGSLGLGLVGYWKMDEASWNGTSGEVKDSAGGNNGTAIGSTVTTGLFNNAGSLNGASNDIEIPSSSNLTLTNSTAAAWVKTNSVSSSQFILAKGALYPNFNYKLEIWSGKFQAAIGIGGVQYYIPGQTATTAWSLVVGTYDGNSFKLYVNGSLNNSMPLTGTPMTNTDKLYIGRYGSAGGYFFNGLIDDVRIYNRALSQTEITRLFNDTNNDGVGEGCIP